MSEAVNPNIDPELSHSGESTRSSEALVESASPGLPDDNSADNGWQTVDFPDAISLTAIPHSESSTNITHNPIPGNSTMSNPFDQANPLGDPIEDSTVIQQLRQENAELRTQAAQLEQDLAQLQIELQLEVARFYCKEQESTELSSNVQSSQQGEELSMAQEQIAQLTDDLELSHQVVERQQILVETLTDQLENSQERIAQLERDCALTQQRYNEQMQLTLQAENTCRDLRMRLHRQQRQALQFKAALEKSLEMSTAAAAVPIEAEPAASSTQCQDAESPFFIPKAQPVQPWSITPETTTNRFYSAANSDASALPNLLSKLRVSDQITDEGQSDVVEAELPNVGRVDTVTAETTIASSEAIAPSSQPKTVQPSENLAHLFPTSPTNQLHPTPTQPPQTAIFDLSPFLEAGEVDPDSIASTNIQTSGKAQPPESSEESFGEAAQEPPQASDDREDTLWADLAKLIEPAAIAENAAIPASLTIQVEPDTHQQPAQLDSTSLPFQPPSQSLNFEVTETVNQQNDQSDRASNSQPISPASFLLFETGYSATAQPIERLRITAQSPSPSVNLASVSPVSTTDETLSSNSLDGSSDSVASPPNWPSPVLYPFRSPKKLTSMAAVELPNFPRTGQ